MEEMGVYFQKLNDEVLRVYEIANAAKAKGFDPDDKVKVPLAKNMAERVEGLISTTAPEIIGAGIPLRIAELEKRYGSQDWRVALKIAEEVAQGKFCQFKDLKRAIEVGIRVGFAYVTVGVVSSPLEGFTSLELRKRRDNGKEYFCLMYSGPIRSAGGTGASVSVVIADYLRTKFGFAEYDPTEHEVKRAYTELMDYHERVTNLQYFPSEEETEFMVKHLPVQISGDPSEKFEVSNYKDLDRIETNRIRNGFCLVIAECLSLKAPKLWKQLSKWGGEFGIGHWKFLEEFLALQKKIKSQGKTITAKASHAKLSPDFTYVKDLVAGRPVITYPLRNGGLRLRYGRARTSGFSTDAIHPATMAVLNGYISIGTQLKTERPGKSTVLSVCNLIDGPTVKLRDGSVKYFGSYQEAKKYEPKIAEVLYLGDILVNYGDFLNRAHKLIPCGFVEEWWVHYLGKYLQEQNLNPASFAEQLQVEEAVVNSFLENPMHVKPSFELADRISDKTGIPLHPKYIFFWNSLSVEQVQELYSCLKQAVFEHGRIVVPRISFENKRALELLGAEHIAAGDEYVSIEGDVALALQAQLGYFKKEFVAGEDALSTVNALSKFRIKDKLGTFIGARMGRPEKAKMRKMAGSPQVLFPVGSEGGRLRSLQSAVEVGKVRSQFPVFYCHSCKKETIFKMCEDCGKFAQQSYYCPKCKKDSFEEICGQHGKSLMYKSKEIDVHHYFKKSLEMAGEKNVPELIKGIRGTSNSDHVPEHIVKGILRAKHNIYVNKDGTTRYDMTEMPCTHFKPREVGVSIERLKVLGYTHDCYGNPLDNGDQVLELKAQDVILPACRDSPDEGADIVLFRVGNFLDDLLMKLYGLEPYYNMKDKSDLVGHLCVAMSPHTAAGIICRIVGFSKTQGFLAHPLLHSIMRRDCDGDEAAVMLLMDHLLNFSSRFLPNTRGATQDAPLVLTSKLIPTEVDDMVFDMDVAWSYPLELYEAAEQYKDAWEVKVEVLKGRLNTPLEYQGYGFTHDTADFNEGMTCSAYKTLPTIKDKVHGQMLIAKKVRAVDEDDVARLIVERHFIRDIKGNLRKFSTQSFRCVSCNEIVRRPPLTGKCKVCGGRLVFTVSEGSIVKYLEPALNLATKYNLSNYLKQTLEVTKARIESIFGKDPEKQEALGKWL